VNTSFDNALDILNNSLELLRIPILDRDGNPLPGDVPDGGVLQMGLGDGVPLDVDVDHVHGLLVLDALGRGALDSHRGVL
jgi:hypothetical protein